MVLEIMILVTQGVDLWAEGVVCGLMGCQSCAVLDIDSGMFSWWKSVQLVTCVQNICTVQQSIFKSQLFEFLKYAMSYEKSERHCIFIQKVFMFYLVLSYNDPIHCISICSQSWSDVIVNNNFSASHMSLKGFIKVSLGVRLDGTL